jgi:hypothetical protein
LSPADTDRRATWERTGQEVAELTDGLGMHIDPGIRDAVTALRLLGLRTEASCEGHDSWGVGAPWDAPMTRQGLVRGKFRAGGRAVG